MPALDTVVGEGSSTRGYQQENKQLHCLCMTATKPVSRGSHSFSVCGCACCAMEVRDCGRAPLRFAERVSRSSDIEQCECLDIIGMLCGLQCFCRNLAVQVCDAQSASSYYSRCLGRIAIYQRLTQAQQEYHPIYLSKTHRVVCCEAYLSPAMLSARGTGTSSCCAAHTIY